MGTKTRHVPAVMALTVAMALSLSIPAQTFRTLQADLTLIVQCAQRPSAKVEIKIEQFLQSAGFQAVNGGEMSRAAGERVELHVFGVEDEKRLLDFFAMPKPQGRYAVTLYSRPPTVRAASLEQRVEAFISKDMKCRVDQATRGENPADMLVRFEELMESMGRFFRSPR